MDRFGSYGQLLYQYVLTAARLEIKEHFCEIATKEVYDNIGQMLSLVRVQLFSLDAETDPAKKKKAMASAQLISKTIKDLRAVTRLFSHDRYINTFGELTDIIQYEINNRYADAVWSEEDYDPLHEFNSNSGIILFGIVLQLFRLFDEQEVALNSIALDFSTGKIIIFMQYKGDEITGRIGQAKDNTPLSLLERAGMINAIVETKNYDGDANSIKLTMSVN